MTTTLSPPPQRSRRCVERIRRFDQARALADGVVLPSDKIVTTLQSLIAPCERVVLEGNNQKQADVFCHSLAKVDPDRLPDVHMIMPGVSRAVQPKCCTDGDGSIRSSRLANSVRTGCSPAPRTASRQHSERSGPARLVVAFQG